MYKPTWEGLTIEQRGQLIDAFKRYVSDSDNALSYRKVKERIRKDPSFEYPSISCNIVVGAAINAGLQIAVCDDGTYRSDISKYGDADFSVRKTWSFVQLYKLLPTRTPGSALFQATLEELERLRKDMSKWDCRVILEHVSPGMDYYNNPKTGLRKLLKWTERMAELAVPFYSGQKVRIFKKETGSAVTYPVHIYQVLPRKKVIRVVESVGEFTDYPYKWEDGEFRVNGNPVYGIN